MPEKKPKPRRFAPVAAEPLPTTKQGLVELAIARGIPSYVAWNLTVPELKKKLEA